MGDKTEQLDRSPNEKPEICYCSALPQGSGLCLPCYSNRNEKPEICYCSALPKGSGLCLPCYTRWLSGPAKTRFRPTISNIAVIAGTIIGIMFGSAVTAQAQIPHINIEETCRAAARAMVGLMGGSTTEHDRNVCLESEQKAREQIIKDQATYSSADKRQCMRTGVYLPSYVEWLTCLEMERDVRKMRGEESPATDTMTLPRVRPRTSY
jgi:hypothetical protein